LSGRFLTKDPEAGHPEIPVTLHRYLYAGADPVNKFDPTGRQMTENTMFMSLDDMAFPAIRQMAGRVQRGRLRSRSRSITLLGYSTSERSRF